MGLAHICSKCMPIWRQLTITNLKHAVSSERNPPTSLQQIQLLLELLYSTGKKTKNGALGMDENNRYSKLTGELSGYGYISGIVTTDNLDGATPAAFCLAQLELEMSKENFK